ncbi:MAG: argininosuccinate lyase [Desulfitibacter sp. BRH_c19]|nr:MAG: argininosuccinate lyase [Desulfitibacter sp. BRH_c19]
MKLWGGRFSKETDKLVEDFHSSIFFDKRLYKQDIEGSKAHARMLGKCGIITLEESQQIIDGLSEILMELEEGKVDLSQDAEDIHMNVETLLIQKIGDVGKKLHTGRSRNDQVALDIRLYLKEEIVYITQMLIDLEKTLLKQADKHLNTIMPGYTHLQKAQPVTFAHHCMAYWEMFYRDIDRLKDVYKRTDMMPLGSGALAGTTFPLDRHMVKEELGFKEITRNSMDAVSDRDFIIEFNSTAAIIMMHLSRFCEELIIWSSDEYRFIEMDDSFSTGSSIMPQKKNPDVAELVRGKTGRVYGNLMAILTVMKGLPLAYNKDMQEDKESLFNSIDTVKGCLITFTPMLASITVKDKVMKEGARGGFGGATDVADYLVTKGIPFREAHKIVGELVAYCISKGVDLEGLKLSEYKEFSNVIENDIFEEVRIENVVAKRNIPGGPAPAQVTNHIDAARKLLDIINI